MIKDRPERIIKNINKQREREYIPPVDPDMSYRRQFSRTKMSWPMYLLLKKQYSVLAVVIALILILFVGLAVLIWYILIPGIIKVLGVLF
jgi:hypothetical protein